MFTNPKLLVLDEATSALDNTTEKAVMEAVEGLSGELTIVMIAHRLSTLAHCDWLIELGLDSTLRMVSPHESLSGIYKNVSKS